MVAAVWTLIGIVVAGGVAFAVDIRVGLRHLGERIDGRIDHLDGRIDHLDGRIDHLDGRIDHLDGRIDAVNSELHGINRTLGQLIATAHVHDHVA